MNTPGCMYLDHFKQVACPQQQVIPRSCDVLCAHPMLDHFRLLRYPQVHVVHQHKMDSVFAPVTVSVLCFSVFQAAIYLHEEKARYPNKITYSVSPPHLSLEALEVSKKLSFFCVWVWVFQYMWVGCV